MMVQASYPLDGGREGIGLLGISARIDPANATVHYDDVRLCHDFHRVPFVGARGPILDPSADGEGRGNASWLRLALEVDKIRSRMAARSFRLQFIPALPQLFFGFSRKEAARFEVTSALRLQAVSSMEANCTSMSLSRLQEDVQQARVQAFDSLTSEAREARLKTAWESAFVSPGEPNNTTGLWLLPHELCTDVYSCVRIFESFEDFVGAPLFNPARNLGGKTVANPAVDVAKEAGIDLVADLESIAGTADGSPELAAVEQRLIALVPTFRQRIGASAEISDQDLLCAICHYEEPVATEPSLPSLSESEQVRKMRASLKEHVSECCSDHDLLDAARKPNAPLIASGLCRVQTLHRSIRMPLIDGLSFTSVELQRDRVHATLWQTRWPADSQRRHATTAEQIAA
jgi:hypothetical protein